ncbi:MAG: autotransporter-associated beta strand repeat-containing protein, partial [Thermoguttaceae bacterium]|nr:autotransporter-associated beta strand repeat-containing protein [Thermoguttaceae bacterium]
NSDSFSVYINGSPSTDWTLSTGSYGSGLYLLANGSGPTPGGEPWYFANTDDINASSWTIDGANKLGVKLLEGDNHSVTYYNPVEMYSSGIVQVGENYNLTLSGAISGSGALEKTDAGKLTINSANDGFTGETTVSGGTLELSGAGTLGSTTINVGQGATMLYNDTVPHNTSLLTYNVNGGTLEFYNTTPATTHTIDNGICSGIEGQDVVINGTGATILIDGGGTISAIAGSGKSSLTFNLDSNSVIDVNSGMFINGSYQTQNWDNNFATLHIGATGKVDLWDGAQMKVGGLTGEAGANIVNESGKSSCKGISIGNGVTADQTFIYNGAITLNEKAVDYVGAGTQVLNGTLTGVTIQSKSGTLVFGVPGDTMTIKPLSRISTEGGAIRIDGNVRLDDSSSYVLCTGAWTGNGTLTIDNGYLRVGNSFDFTGGITFNGGLILNNDNDATLAADITVTKDGSDIHAGWSKSMVLTGKLKGDKSLTIGSDSGNLRFAGDATEYTGSYLVKGNMRVGVAGTEQVDTTTYLGSSPILLNGGMIQNQDNNITITNDLNFVSDSDLKSGWSKDTTYTGAITGSGRLRVVSDSGWVIMGTSCDGTFTGDVQANWDSTSKMGNIRLAAQQPFGPNAGRANIYGQLDMN